MIDRLAVRIVGGKFYTLLCEFKASASHLSLLANPS